MACRMLWMLFPCLSADAEELIYGLFISVDLRVIFYCMAMVNVKRLSA